MEITIKGEKKYDSTVPFTITTNEEMERVYLKYQAREEDEENDYDGTREIGVEKDEFLKMIRLVAKVPSIETKLDILQDSWNTYPSDKIEIKGEYDNENLLIIRIEYDDYVFYKEEWLAIIEAID